MAPSTTKYHQKLLEAVQLLATKIECMDGCDASQLKECAEIYTSIENIISLLGAKKPPSQSPLLDQLLDELQKLKSSTPSSLPAIDQWRRLAGVEENLVHVIANVGYDILTAVQDMHSKIAILAEAHQPAEPVGLTHTFTVDPKCSKQESIIKYMHFLHQIPRCEGECLCRTSLESTNLKAPAYRCQNVGQLDQQIHFASPVPLYEVCPIEVIFKSFEYENGVVVIINFAAAASYTNFVSSVFIPNQNGPIPVQIPWMSNMQNVHVLGKVAAEIQFSTKTYLPITFQMNVIDLIDNGNRVVIFGRDFVDKHVQSVHHDSNTVILKDSWEAEKTFEKQFVYLANVLREVETKFCRYRLKKEVKDVEDVQARIDRLQRVLVKHTPTSDQTSGNQTEEPKSVIDKQNAKTSDLEPNSVPQNIEKDTLKSCGEVKDVINNLKSSFQSNNMQQQMYSESSSLKDIVKENPVSSSPTKIVVKEDVCSMVPKDQQEEDLKLSSQLKISEENVSTPSTTQLHTERKAVKATAVESQNLDNFQDVRKDDLKMSSQSRNMGKEIPTTKLMSSVFEENLRFPLPIAENKISNTSGPSKSLTEKELVKLSSQLKNMEKASQPTIQLKRDDIETLKLTLKSVVELNQYSERKPVEMESVVEHEKVDSKNLFQTGSVEAEIATLPFPCAQHKAHRTRCSKLGEREPSCFHQNIVVSEEENSNLLKMENAEKIALDPTRVQPPVVKKKGSSELMPVDPFSPFGNNEALNENWKPLLPAGNTEKVQMESNLQFGNEDQKAKSMPVINLDPSLLCHRTVVVKEKNKPPSEPEKTKKQELKHIFQNVHQRKDYLKRSVLIPTSVIKNQHQENQSAESSSKELTPKPMNVKTAGSQDVDERPETNVSI